MLDRHLEMPNVEATTLDSYEVFVRNHIRPLIGHVQLAAGSLLELHGILNGAGKRAARWGWIGRNPFELAEPISVPHFDPQPPTAVQAAAIAEEAWRDLDWGMLVWLAMTTGATR
jgi:hypothetical protein